MKKLIENIWFKTTNHNKQNIISLLDVNPDAGLLDLGCDDRVWTIELSKKAGTSNLVGIEIVDEKINEAKRNGIKVFKSDLNYKLLFKDNFFNIIHVNQVIEHINYLDLFISHDL